LFRVLAASKAASWYFSCNSPDQVVGVMQVRLEYENPEAVELQVETEAALKRARRLVEWMEAVCMREAQFMLTGQPSRSTPPSEFSQHSRP
jgi:hypothetical protein